MQLYIRYQIIFFICSIFITACSSDYTKQFENIEAGTISMQIDAKVQTQSADEVLNKKEASTRSSDVIASEEKISNLQIFFFDALSSELIWKPQSSDLRYSSEGILLINIPSVEIRQSIASVKVKLYVVTNTKQIRAINETYLLNHRVEEAQFLKATQPSDFVMIGFKSTQIRFVGNASNIGLISLNRLVSKVEPAYPRIPSTGIELMNAKGESYKYLLDGNDAVSVCMHGINTTSLLNANQFDNSPRNISDMSEFHLVEKDDSRCFYSYSYSWDNSDEGAYLIYRLRLKQADTKEIKYYYYRISLKDNMAPDLMELKPNHHYLILPRIETLGATDPEQPIMINSQFVVWDWTMRNLESSIVDANYFMIREYDVKMPNIREYRVKFAASSQVKFKGVNDAWYWTWEKISSRTEDLRAVKTKLKTNNISYPRIEVVNSGKEKMIIIRAEVPDNFSPHYFTLSFEDANGLTESISVEHYPARFITGVRSEENDKDPYVYYAHDMGYNTSLQSQNNFNLFTITTLAGGEEFNGRRYRIGDPTYRKNGKIYTYEDYEHNQLVSPRFVIASQRSIYYRTMYNRGYYSNQIGRNILSARERCANYAEGGYPVGTWRLPTEAELEYISEIQNNRKSPVNSLFDGSMYWSAASYRYYIFKNENSYYDGSEGFFGNYITADVNFQNDGYYILPNQSPVYISNNPSAPHFEAFVDPAGVYDRYSTLSTRFYYSSFVRCVRDL